MTAPQPTSPRACRGPRVCFGALFLALLAAATGCVTPRATPSLVPEIPENAEPTSAPEEWNAFPSSTTGAELALEDAPLTPPPEFPAGDPIDWSRWDPIDDLPLEALPDLDPTEAEDVEPEQSGAGLSTGLERPSRAAITALGQFVVRVVSRWVGLRSLRKVSARVPDDCSGLVRLAYERAGLDPLGNLGRPGDNAVTTIWRRAYRLGALKRSAPRPGDLVFFRNTWDRNRDGRYNDGLTHVGIVERVAADGTVTFIHRSSRGITRDHLHPQRPDVRTDDSGRVHNDYLRRPDGTDGPRLTGELFAGYASIAAFRRDSPVARHSGSASR